MFENVKAFFNVLEAGRSLKNPAAWKNGQTALNSGILAILMSLKTFLPPEYQPSDDVLYNVGLILGAAGALVNMYLTTATSEKVGISKTCKKD